MIKVGAKGSVIFFISSLFIRSFYNSKFISFTFYTVHFLYVRFLYGSLFVQFTFYTVHIIFVHFS